MYKNLVLVLLACVAAILLGEFVVSSIHPQNLSAPRVMQSDSGYLLNKSSGRVRHQSGQRVVYYDFSWPHLRGDSPTNGVKRILALGDSFTFGSLLSESDTYINLLQKNIDSEFGVNQYQLLNMGTGGWGLADYVRAMEDFGDIINPEIVLVFFNTDDIGRSIKLGMYTLDDRTGLVLRDNSGKLPLMKGKRLVKHIPGYQWVLEHSHIANLLKGLFYNRIPRQGLADRGSSIVPSSPELNVPPKDSQRLGQALFHRLKKWCDQRDVLLMVTTTGFHKFSNGKPNEPTKAFMENGTEIFSEEEILFFDISNELYEEVNGIHESIVIEGDQHPNEAGAKLIAKLVWPWLREQLRSKQR